MVSQLPQGARRAWLRLLSRPLCSPSRTPGSGYATASSFSCFPKGVGAQHPFLSSPLPTLLCQGLVGVGGQLSLPLEVSSDPRRGAGRRVGIAASPLCHRKSPLAPSWHLSQVAPSRRGNTRPPAPAGRPSGILRWLVAAFGCFKRGSLPRPSRLLKTAQQRVPAGYFPFGDPSRRPGVGFSKLFP